MDKYTECKIKNGSLYGKTVTDMVKHFDPCKHCPHFDEETFKCDKELIGHHCDCDCPECSPESYADPEDFYADDADEIDDDEFFDNITKVYDNPWNDLKIDELLGK